MSSQIEDFKNNEKEFVASVGIRGSMVGFENWRSGLQQKENDVTERTPDLVYFCMTEEMVRRNLMIMKNSLYSLRRAKGEKHMIRCDDCPNAESSEAERSTDT